MQTVLIDTDIVIDYLRGIERVKALVEFLWKMDTAHLSILSVYELYAGMKKKERQDTKNFIQNCNVDFITFEITQEAGELYQQYRRRV